MTTSPRIQLIFDQDCPNVPVAREHLRICFARLGLAPSWQEWERSAPGTPAEAIRYGSPTVLVDGQDVAGQPPSDAPCCRFYRGTNGGREGAPPVEMLMTVLGNAAPNRGRPSGWQGTVAALPGLAAALLPAVACPACWPAYVAALGSLGMGALAQRDVQLPLTALLMVGAVIALAWGAPRRHGYGPAALAGLAAVVVLVGKFVLDLDPIHWTGSVLLVASVVWNAWPQGTRRSTCCVITPPNNNEVRPEAVEHSAK